MAGEERPMRWLPERPMAFIVAAVAIIVALLGVSAFAQIQATDTAARTAHSLAVSDLAERLLGTVRDAETGQRGFLLTGQQSYLEPYDLAATTVAGTYSKLIDLVGEGSVQHTRVLSLKAPIDAKMAELAQTITLERSGDHSGALALVAAGTGKAAMDDLRSRVVEIELAEMSSRRALSDLEDQRRLLNLVAFLVALIGLMLLGWWLLRLEQFRARELERSNASLEARVAERTAAVQKEQNRVELLLHDMNHRVGNNLSVIAAILGMQRRQSRDPEVKDALAVAEERIAAIGATQRRLRLNLDSDDVDGRQFFLDLAEDLRRSCEGRPITIATEIDEVRLPGREAVTYGVLVNELMTNSVKHAFPDGMSGTVTLSVKMPEPGAIRVEVSDDGVGVPGGDGKGLGTTILTGLAKSLGADVHSGPAAPETSRPGVRTSFTAVTDRIAKSA